MCNTYCSSCTNCLSNCTCTATVTPICSNNSACITTTYSKCVLYSGDTLTGCVALANGETLDVSIGKLVAAICGLTPADLAWATFNYSCLLDTGGGAITTAQEFAETVAATLCTLTAGTLLLPSGTTIPTSPTAGIGALVPGTSTLATTFTSTFQDIADLNTFNTTGTVTTACSAGVWTAVPSGTSLKQWILWVKTNVCSLVLAVQNRATTLETFKTNTDAFIGSYSLIDNTDCLSGSGADTLDTTIALLKTKVCAINTLVSALPSFTAVSLPWSTCGGTIGGVWAGYTNSASLVTQLTRIVTQLAERTYTFEPTEFTTTPGACGSSVSMVTAPSPFTCLSLAACTLQNLGNVNDGALGAGAGDKFKLLSWSTTALEFLAKPLSFTSTSGTTITTFVDNGTTLVANIEANVVRGSTIDNTSISTPILISSIVASAGTQTINLEYNSTWFNTPVASSWTPSTSANYLVIATTSSYAAAPATAAYYVNGTVFFTGAIELTVKATNLAIGTVQAIGAVAAAIRPTVAVVFNCQVVDTTTHIPYACTGSIDAAGGIISIRNQVQLPANAVVALVLGGINYKL